MGGSSISSRSGMLQSMASKMRKRRRIGSTLVPIYSHQPKIKANQVHRIEHLNGEPITTTKTKRAPSTRWLANRTRRVNTGASLQRELLKALHATLQVGFCRGSGTAGVHAHMFSGGDVMHVVLAPHR